jgi:hypothetical protein
MDISFDQSTQDISLLKPVLEWSVEDLCMFLSSKGLDEETVELFEIQGIDGEQFSKLDKRKLEHIGVTTRFVRNAILLLKNEVVSRSGMNSVCPAVSTCSSSSGSHMSLDPEQAADPKSEHATASSWSFCREHPKQKLLFTYCAQDRTLVCEECITTSHAGHRFVAGALICQERRDSIKKKVAQLENLNEEVVEAVLEKGGESLAILRTNQETTTEDIKSYFEMIREAVTDAEDEALTTFHALVTKKKKDVQDELVDASNWRHGMEDLCCNASDVLNQTDDYKFLSDEQAVSANLDEYLDMNVPTSSPVHAVSAIRNKGVQYHALLQSMISFRGITTTYSVN